MLTLTVLPPTPPPPPIDWATNPRECLPSVLIWSCALPVKWTSPPVPPPPPLAPITGLITASASMEPPPLPPPPPIDCSSTPSEWSLAVVRSSAVVVRETALPLPPPPPSWPSAIAPLGECASPPPPPIDCSLIAAPLRPVVLKLEPVSVAETPPPVPPAPAAAASADTPEVLPALPPPPPIDWTSNALAWSP